MFTFLSAIILGVIEGITEFLPISSTGHLILTAKFLKLPPSEFLRSFEIIIQLGAILAVIVLYGKKLLVQKELLKKIIVAFLPTAFLGALFYKIIKHYLLDNTIVVILALLIGGIILIVFEYFYRKKESSLITSEQISYKHALIIGLVQALAFIPGVSRSATTIIGGMMLGYKRKTVVEFSFLLAVPVMAAATGLDLLKNYQNFSTDQAGLLLAGFITSFVIALLAIKFLLKFIQKHSFIVFGIYRILLALVILFIIK